MSVDVIESPGLCELRLNAPPGNIMTRSMCEELARVVRDKGSDRMLKAFVLTSSGKHFSFGASVQEHVVGEVEIFLPAFHGVFLALAGTCVPVVGAVRGQCLGGAFELVAFAHHVVAERGARFGAPEISLGVLPPAACILLPWRLSGADAEDLILTGRSVSAESCGIVTRLCDEGELEGETEQFVDRYIRPRSAKALRMAVRATRGPLHAQLQERLPELERLYLDDLMATRDAHEGIAAFLEKREPKWVHA
ncbi:MAG: enoyl-CoA hydratase/isomerase family protein [Planctomycetota bacterium]|jgi:cyclohexa-1,5-dienecarbonyl-CoA hydratase